MAADDSARLRGGSGHPCFPSTRVGLTDAPHTRTREESSPGAERKGSSASVSALSFASCHFAALLGILGVVLLANTSRIAMLCLPALGHQMALAPLVTPAESPTVQAQIPENSTATAPPWPATLLASSSNAAAPTDSTPMATARAQELLQLWDHTYGLQKPLAPAQVNWKGQKLQSQRVPRWAPHLEHCSEAAAHRQHQEFAVEGEGAGGYPEWACPEAGGNTFCMYPQPPWILGGDEANLALTRRVQRDIWVRQFPADKCADPGTRFLVTDWISGGFGIGSQTSLMDAALGLATLSKRVLVTTGYWRARHAGCRRFKQAGKWECYFSRLTWEECSAKALGIVEQKNMSKHMEHGVVHSKAPVVYLNPRVFGMRLLTFGANAYKDLKPWGTISHLELMGGVIPSYPEKWAKVTWWQGQSSRFLMRWPSAYLCHLTNKARQAAFGQQVADSIALAETEQDNVLAGHVGTIQSTEAEGLRSFVDLGKLWVEETDPWKLQSEPYVPRPMVSVHVRIGDKASEMKLFEFETYMWLAYRVRWLVPETKFIWLSTEMERVVAASAQYRDWVFFYTNTSRQPDGMRMAAFEKTFGLEERVGDSFVNLMIAAQCDMFVGVLGSNWNRLINRLRLTNGRLKATYIAANNDMW